MAHIPRVTWSENGDQPWNAECLDTNCHWSACGGGWPLRGGCPPTARGLDPGGRMRIASFAEYVRRYLPRDAYRLLAGRSSWT